MLSRRSFVFALAAPVVLRYLPQDGHPEPRPGIDASRVLTPEALRGYNDEIREAFSNIREIPQIADGLRCYCGCAGRPGMRSLLTCFEAPGMATDCDICQSEARLAHRRHREGQTLAQIRRAVEARFA